MDEYITKESALSCFHDWIDRYGHEHTADEMVEYQRIEDLPEEDVRPVVKAHWDIFDADNIFDPRMVCSNCKTVDTPLAIWRYCPCCGADMWEVTADG